jgi:hypothetical protein
MQQQDLKQIIAGLGQTPKLLSKLLSEIPPERMKERRIPGKWSIHEHAVHLAEAQAMLNGRLKRFAEEPGPKFVPYLPGKGEAKVELLSLDLKDRVAEFRRLREEAIEFAKAQNAEYWQREGEHPEYERYTPFIMLRHMLLHDHLHLYRIEELALTRDAYLPKGK